MKKQVLRMSMFLSLLVIWTGMCVGASAQTARPVVVEIPFEFFVGEKSLPAGTYIVRRLVRDSDKTLLIQSRDGDRALTVSTNVVETRDEQKTTKLNFRKIGDQYFLSQIWTAGARVGRETGKSPLERELSKRRKADGALAAQQDAAKMAGTVVSITGRLP